MIVKMMITFDYDPETNEYTPIKQEIIKDKEKVITEAQKAEDSGEPQLTLEANKYVLNTSAVTLLNAEVGDRIDIRYQPLNGGSQLFPLIGTATAWKTSSGNKLTKSLTVSFRGKSNEQLSTYGDTFAITPWQGHEGLYVLIGNKDKEVIEDENVEIKETVEPEVDKSFEEDVNASLSEDEITQAPYEAEVEMPLDEYDPEFDEDDSKDIDDDTFEL